MPQGLDVANARQVFRVRAASQEGKNQQKQGRCNCTSCAIAGYTQDEADKYYSRRNFVEIDMEG